MLIECFGCRARYDVPAEAVRPGRAMRCVGCGKVWVPCPAEAEAAETGAAETGAAETGEADIEPAGIEAPRTGAPQTEAPRTEAPRTEAPGTEAPRTEAPGTEAREIEPAESEAAATEPASTPAASGHRPTAGADPIAENGTVDAGERRAPLVPARRVPGRAALALAWIGTVIVLAAAGWAIWHFRVAIGHAWPPSRRLLG